MARVFSTSSTAPHLFGDRREDYERDLREILTQASPSGRFSLRLPDNILRIWRLPALSGGSADSARIEGADIDPRSPTADHAICKRGPPGHGCADARGGIDARRESGIRRGHYRPRLILSPSAEFFSPVADRNADKVYSRPGVAHSHTRNDISGPHACRFSSAPSSRRVSDANVLGT